MSKKKPKKWILPLIIIVVLLGVIIAMLIALKPMPIALLNEYGIGALWEEGLMMNECAECHNGVDFHSCETCHDEHGSVELANIPFSEIVELTGDVPDPSFVRINQVLPDQDNLGTHITLFKFFEMYGINEFDSVTFTTNDGGFATIESKFLDETAMLVPYIDGVRFITESVHNSTWLKGVSRITVVGTETPLTIDGAQTSIGRLLTSNETIRFIVEGSNTMLENDDGITSSAFVANWVEGTRLLPFLKSDAPNSLTVTDSEGNTIELAFDEFQNAIIAIVRDEVTLVLPDRGRSAWPTKIVSIESN